MHKATRVCLGLALGCLAWSALATSILGWKLDWFSKAGIGQPLFLAHLMLAMLVFVPLVLLTRLLLPFLLKQGRWPDGWLTHPATKIVCFALAGAAVFSIVNDTDGVGFWVVAKMVAILGVFGAVSGLIFTLVTYKFDKVSAYG